MQRNLRFALFGNTYQEHKSAHVTHLLEILRGKGAEICISNEFYDFLKQHTKANLDGLEIFKGYDLMQTWHSVSVATEPFCVQQAV